MHSVLATVEMELGELADDSLDSQADGHRVYRPGTRLVLSSNDPDRALTIALTVDVQLLPTARTTKILGKNKELMSVAAQEVRGGDAEETLQSKWSGEVVSGSLELSLKHNPAGNPPHDIFQGEPQTHRNKLSRPL